MEWILIISTGFILFSGSVLFALRRLTGDGRETGRNGGWTPDTQGYSSTGGSGGTWDGDSGGGDC
jgi:hypothetical protein